MTLCKEEMERILIVANAILSEPKLKIIDLTHVFDVPSCYQGKWFVDVLRGQGGKCGVCSKYVQDLMFFRNKALCYECFRVEYCCLVCGSILSEYAQKRTRICGLCKFRLKNKEKKNDKHND